MKRVEFVDTGGVAGFYLEVRATRQGEGVYWVRYRRRDDRRLTHYKIGRTTEIGLADARKEAKRIRAEAVLGGDPAGEVRTRREVPTYRNFFLESYMPHVELRKRSHKDDLRLGRRIIEAVGHKKVNQVSRSDVVALQSKLAAEGLAPATVNHHIKVLRYSLNLAVEWGLMEQNPAKRLPMLFEDNKRERLLSDEELERLLHVLRTDRNRTVCRIILLLMATGMRLNEVLAATWSEVDLDKRVFVVRARNSKSKRVRSVPINDAALEVLRELPTKEVGGPLFVNPRTGNRYRSIAKPWGRIRQEADIPGFRIHDCRHFFASALVSSGRTLYEAGQILGHSSPSVTMRYAHLSTRSLQEAASAASVKLNGTTGPSGR